MNGEGAIVKMPRIMVTEERVTYWRGLLRCAISVGTVKSVRIEEGGSFSFDFDRGIPKLAWLLAIGGVLLYLFLTWVNLDFLELSEGARTWSRYSIYALPALTFVLILILSFTKGPQFSVYIETPHGFKRVYKTSYKQRAERVHQSI